MSVIYDFVCTPPEEYGQSLDGDLHTTLMEFPTYTYTGKLVDTCPCLYDAGGGGVAVGRLVVSCDVEMIVVGTVTMMSHQIPMLYHQALVFILCW